MLAVCRLCSSGDRQRMRLNQLCTDLLATQEQLPHGCGRISRRRTYMAKADKRGGSSGAGRGNFASVQHQACHFPQKNAALWEPQQAARPHLLPAFEAGKGTPESWLPACSKTIHKTHLMQKCRRNPNVLTPSLPTLRKPQDLIRLCKAVKSQVFNYKKKQKPNNPLLL